MGIGHCADNLTIRNMFCGKAFKIEGEAKVHQGLQCKREKKKKKEKKEKRKKEKKKKEEEEKKEKKKKNDEKEKKEKKKKTLYTTCLKV